MKFWLTPEEKAAKAAAYCVKPQDESNQNPDSASEDACRASFVSQAQLATFFICLGVCFLLLGFAFNTPQEIWRGMAVILTSPANLITDYFELANVGATLVNAGAMLLFTLSVIWLSGANITGAVIAGLFTVTGFSFFGKNLVNTLPIMLGVYAYARMLRLPLSSVIVQSLFGTSLGPLVSEICFNVGLPLLPALVLGVASGILVGLIITPLAAHFIKFHKGYSLYNIGFTAGIIGMVFMAVLRGFGVTIETVSILSKGNSAPFIIALYGLFAIMLILGLLLNHWRIKGLSYLFSLTGALSTDFTALAGFGATTINMSLLGMLGTTYTLVPPAQPIISRYAFNPEKMNGQVGPNCSMRVRKKQA